MQILEQANTGCRLRGQCSPIRNKQLFHITILIYDYTFQIISRFACREEKKTVKSYVRSSLSLRMTLLSPHVTCCTTSAVTSSGTERNGFLISIRSIGDHFCSARYPFLLGMSIHFWVQVLRGDWSRCEAPITSNESV